MSRAAGELDSKTFTHEVGSVLGMPLARKAKEGVMIGSPEKKGPQHTESWRQSVRSAIGQAAQVNNASMTEAYLEQHPERP
jgi:hypothetical protein